MKTILIDRHVLSCLSAVAGSALEDLSSGLADGTYEDDDIGGWSSEAISAAISEADALLEKEPEEPKAEEPTEPKFAPGTQVYIRRIGKTMTVIRSERPYGHEQRYVLRNRDNQIESQWREDELELADEDRAVKCDNCDWKGTETECNEAKDLSERLDPGCEVPAGECPECGCLAYLVKEQPEPVYQRSANSGIEWPITPQPMRDEGDVL